MPGAFDRFIQNLPEEVDETVAEFVDQYQQLTEAANDQLNTQHSNFWDNWLSENEED